MLYVIIHWHIPCYVDVLPHKCPGWKILGSTLSRYLLSKEPCSNLTIPPLTSVWILSWTSHGSKDHYLLNVTLVLKISFRRFFIWCHNVAAVYSWGIEPLLINIHLIHHVQKVSIYANKAGTVGNPVSSNFFSENGLDCTAFPFQLATSQCTLEGSLTNINSWICFPKF